MLLDTQQTVSFSISRDRQSDNGELDNAYESEEAALKTAALLRLSDRICCSTMGIDRRKRWQLASNTGRALHTVGYPVSSWLMMDVTLSD